MEGLKSYWKQVSDKKNDEYNNKQSLIHALGGDLFVVEHPQNNKQIWYQHLQSPLSSFKWGAETHQTSLKCKSQLAALLHDSQCEVLNLEQGERRHSKHLICDRQNCGGYNNLMKSADAITWNQPFVDEWQGDLYSCPCL